MLLWGMGWAPLCHQPGSRSSWLTWILRLLCTAQTPAAAAVPVHEHQGNPDLVCYRTHLPLCSLGSASHDMHAGDYTSRSGQKRPLTGQALT